MIEMFKEVLANKLSISQRRLSFGVGINDAEYLTEFREDGKRFACPFYAKWQNMIKRCYSASYQKRQPTYKGCSVCDDWLIFSSFKAWMIKQDWQDKHLDKDIIKTGNKVYSPETCLFVTQEINSLLNDREALRGDYPQGVSFNKAMGKFVAYCRTGGKQKHIGTYSSPESASEKYLIFKSEVIIEAANNQKEPLKGYLIKIAKTKIGC